MAGLRGFTLGLNIFPTIFLPFFALLRTEKCVNICQENFNNTKMNPPPWYRAILTNMGVREQVS